jgi:hypothetical protein
VWWLVSVIAATSETEKVGLWFMASLHINSARFYLKNKFGVEIHTYNLSYP